MPRVEDLEKLDSLRVLKDVSHRRFFFEENFIKFTL
jgi:hypothetical protein